MDTLASTEAILWAYWQGFVQFIPQLVIALVLTVLGLLVAKGVQRTIVSLLSQEKIEDYFKRMGWSEFQKEAKIEHSVAGLIGEIVYWILLLITFVVVFDVLGFDGFARFLERAILFLPKVIVAGFIFGVTALLASFSEKVVRASLTKSRIEYAKQAGKVARWSIWIFGLFAILTELEIATRLVVSLFQAILAFLVISLGLAFGLGGKEVASRIWEKAYQELTEHKE